MVSSKEDDRICANKFQNCACIADIAESLQVSSFLRCIHIIPRVHDYIISIANVHAWSSIWRSHNRDIQWAMNFVVVDRMYVVYS